MCFFCLLQPKGGIIGGSALPETSRKRIVAILVYVPLNFRSKMLEIQHFTQFLNGLGKLTINSFQMYSTHMGTTSNEKISLIPNFYVILVQFYAQKVGVFSPFSNIFIFTSLAINYSPKLWHRSICHSFQQSVFSFHRRNYTNLTRIIGSVTATVIHTAYHLSKWTFYSNPQWIG